MNNDHEWVVFSTAIEDHCLMLQCVECGALGTIDSPTRQEWTAAFHAPSMPYRWRDAGRVHLRHQPPCPLYVVRAEMNGSTCSCPSRLNEQRIQEYERFPGEIPKPDDTLTEDDKADLMELANVVYRSDLCSRLFPFFIHSYQGDTGHEPTGAVKRIASRIEKVDRIGLHCSPSVVALVLRKYAEGPGGE